MQLGALGGEDLLEEALATTSVFLPEESPWAEEPGQLRSTGHGWGAVTPQAELCQLPAGTMYLLHQPVEGIMTKQLENVNDDPCQREVTSK